MTIFLSDEQERKALPAKFNSQIVAQESNVGAHLVRRSRAQLEAMPARSSIVTNTLQNYENVFTPDVEFVKAYEYYKTVPEFQNVVEQIIAEVTARDWRFDGPASGVNAMEEWEQKFDLRKIFEYLIRDWLVTGNSIMSVADWHAVQMSTIYGMERDRYGNTVAYVQRVNEAWVKLSPKQFIHTRFIDINREAWGIPWAHSLMTIRNDVDGHKTLSEFDWWMQLKQDSGRMTHRLGAPRLIYYFPGIDQNTIDQKIGPALQQMQAGDTLAFGGQNIGKPELIPEVVETKTRFEGQHAIMKNSIEAGLQSSAIRLITEPSAMADAAEANKKDDSRILGVMERLRVFMDQEVIPRVTGYEKTEFKWGAKDKLNLDFTAILALCAQPILTIEEKRRLLASIGIPLDENVEIPDPIIQAQQDKQSQQSTLQAAQAQNTEWHVQKLRLAQEMIKKVNEI